MKEDIRQIKARLDSLGTWQAKVIGGSVVISTAVAIVFGVVELILMK